MNEIIVEGTIAMIAGMGAVFTVLVLISLLISSLKFLNTGSKVTPQKNTQEALIEDDSIRETQEEEEERRRVVAAISVALSKSLNTSVDRLKIKAIRRV